MKNRISINLGLTSLFIILNLGTVWAQDNLYGPSAPPDATYLRVVNAVPGREAAVRLADADYLVGFATVTAYQVLEPGETILNIAGEDVPLMVEAGEFYTAVVTPEGVNVLHDTALVDASRVLLTLYNFSSLGPIDLKTADGETDIVSGVAPLSEESIVVNQAEVALGVFSGEERVIGLEPKLLERGVAYGVFVFDEASDGEGGPVVAVVPATLQEE